MIARLCMGFVALVVALGLTGCGERPQSLGGPSAAKRDAAPHTGGSASAFTQSGWKVGDANSWAQQLKARAQYGQNDHQRVVKP